MRHLVLKILTLNVFRYYGWRRRKKKLIEFLKEVNADIIAMQEVAEDFRFKKKFANQLQEINLLLGYPYTNYERLRLMRKWHSREIDWLMYYGFGLLSKFPVLKKELVILPKVEKEKDSGFAYYKLRIEDDSFKVYPEIDLINVHLENTDIGARKQLKLILNFCEEKSIKPIILGDFNMKNIQDLKELLEKEYYVSYFIKPYYSFLPTKHSHNTGPITLDYVVAHKEKYVINDVLCYNKDISDHKPVMAEVIMVN